MYFVSFFFFRYRNWSDGQSMSLLLILRVHVQVVYSLLWRLCDMLVFISYPTLFVVSIAKYFHCLYLIISLTCVFQTCSLC